MTTNDPRLDRFTTFSREWVEKAGTVALQTNDQIARGAFDYAEWAKSMLDLVDFGLAGALDLAPDLMLPGLPGTGDDEPDRSDYIEVDPDGHVDRTLSVVPGSFRHVGSPMNVIPDSAIDVEPRELKPLQTLFRLAVRWPALRSGTYRGRIRLAPARGAAGPTTVIEVTVDL